MGRRIGELAMTGAEQVRRYPGAARLGAARRAERARRKISGAVVVPTSRRRYRWRSRFMFRHP